MAGRIPQTFIDELLARADIVSLVDARVPLRKSGHEFKACCPFHNEKTPSFYVSPTKQFYHCFGCGAHGTALGFLIEYDRLDFPDAVEELARDLGLTVPREQGAAPSRRVEPLDELRALAERVAEWYRRQLRDHPQRARAVDYLKRRGVDGETAARFGLGFAPPGWEALQAGLGGDAAHDNLARLGLLVERDSGGSYDRFRNRIMFPIRDRRGRTVGFGGRTLDDDPAKYMNSPESALFHKGRELYGLHEARQATRQLERLVVVEGYMDVVALAQHGIPFAVATLGTATTPDHLEMLYRAAPAVVFCFDGDAAGRQAAWRALEQALPAMRDGRQASFLFLPDGEDPDSLVRSEGSDRFLARLDGAVPLSDVLLDHLAERVDTGSVDGRARLAELARPLLVRLPDGLFRDMLTERLGEIVKWSGEKLSKLIFEPVVKSTPTAVSRRRGAAHGAGPSPVRTSLALLLRQPAVAEMVVTTAYWERLDWPGIDLLIEMLGVLQQHPGLTTAALLERWADHAEGRHLYRLLRDEDPNQQENVEQVFCDSVAQIERQARRQRIDELSSRGVARLTDEEKNEYQELMRTAAGR